MPPPEFGRFYSQIENSEVEQPSKTAIIYAGQGQDIEKLRTSTIQLREYPAALDVYNQGDEFLHDKFPDRFNGGFSPIILKGSEDDLRQNQQLLVLFYNLACTEVLEKEKDNFRLDNSDIVAVSGQSLGLINAIKTSGAIDVPNMLYLGVERQDAMQEANAQNPGTQVALLASDSDERVKKLMDTHSLEISIITGSNLVVLGGSVDAVNQAIEAAKKERVRAFPLNTDGAFHTSLMEPATARLRLALKKIEIKNAQIPIIANTTGNEIHASGRIKKEIIDQLTKPVLWLKSTKRMTDKVDQFVEIGNDGLLTGHIKREIENSTGGEKNSLVKRVLQASGEAVNAIGATLVIRQPLKNSTF